LTNEQELIFKSARYANYLKVIEAKNNGVKVEEIQNKMKAFYAEIQNANMQIISTEETLEEDKAAYETIRASFL
jgi:hypothetical protein